MKRIKMAPKKKERESENFEQKKTDHIQADQEMFLNAFEKPTQIYRYLRTRNMISPIFLNRNLSYMRHRLSRKSKDRKSFSIDSILMTKANDSNKKLMVFDGKHLVLTFLEFNDKQFEGTDGMVKVDVILVKSALKKRKDISNVVNTNIGTIEVPINPAPSVDRRVPAISISTTKFDADTFQQAKYTVAFRIETIPPGNGVLSSLNGEEPKTKKLKLSSKTYSFELPIVDRNGPCLLTEGEYDMIAMESQTNNAYSPKKLPNWEYLNMDSEFVDDFSVTESFGNAPTLKFRLSWAKQEIGGMVEYPEPIAMYETENKENLTAEMNAKNNNNNTINDVKEEDKGGEKVRIIYQFIYNNNSRQQTEACSDFYCPWCSLNCKKLHSLIKHLKLCHARFIFNYVPLEHGGARIDVAINENYDGSYTGSPHDLAGPNNFARTVGPKRRSSVTNILVCRTRRNRASLNDFLELDENDFDSNRPYISGHNRLYHHTMTCLPVMPKELDIDSEGESDPSWLQQKTMQMIDEFTDVNSGEKELMKMWNLHVMRYGYVGDVQIPIACNMFLENHGKTIIAKNLYKNFIVHLTSLFDYGLVSPEVYYEMVKKIQDFLRESDEFKQVMKKRFEDQALYWKETGEQKHIQEQKRLEEKKAKEKEEEEKRKLEEKELGIITSTTTNTAKNVTANRNDASSSSSTLSSSSNTAKSKDHTSSNNNNNNHNQNFTATASINTSNNGRQIGKGRNSASVGIKKLSLNNTSSPSSSKNASSVGDSYPRRRSAGSIPPLKSKSDKHLLERRRSVAVSTNIQGAPVIKVNPKIVLTRNKTTQLSTNTTTTTTNGRTRNSTGSK